MRVRAAAAAAACVVLASFALLAACSRSPASPSGSPGAGSGSGTTACRTYATAYSYVTASPGGTAETSARCGIEPGTTSLACTFTQSSSPQGCTTAWETRTTYVSLADFVNEPIGSTRARDRITRGTATSPSCPAGSNPDTTTTYLYDSTRRLLQVTTTGAASPPTVTSYTLWDGRGRPTLGTIAVPGQPSTIVSFVFDDPGRTCLQLLTVAGGQSFATVLTYDADGLPLRSRGDTPQGTIDSVFTTASRTQVCQ